jgi:NitT/TauT family transport system permease protein
MNMKQVERWSPWLLLVAVIALWQIICSAFNVSEFIFPSPARIWNQFIEYRGLIAGHAWRTFWVTMVGFGIAIVVGVLLGFIIGSSRLAYAAVYPLMTGFNALPKAAFVPILVVWFGIGVGPAILTAFLISFFPIMVNIATGLATLEPELEDVLRVLGAKRWDVLVKVGLPRSMPYFYGSLKVAITLAFVGTTVSEMTAANEGIGYLLISAGSAMQMGLAFAGLLVVGGHGDGDVRTVQLHRKAYHRLGAPRLAESLKNMAPTLGTAYARWPCRPRCRQSRHLFALSRPALAGREPQRSAPRGPKPPWGGPVAV